jgi:biopolymer transport protein TolQ
MNASSTAENLEHVVSTANNSDLSLINLILSADLVGKLVIIILVLASIWSWGIIVNKLKSFSGIRSRMSDFENLF